MVLVGSVVGLSACEEETTSDDDDGAGATGGTGGTGTMAGGAGGAGGDVGGTGGSGGTPECDADLENDPLNCGSCERDCLGGACENGACLPVLLHDDNFFGPMATDGAHVYWFDDDLQELWRVATSGGAAASVADLGALGVNSVSALVATSGGVVATGHGTDTLLLGIVPETGAVEELFAAGNEINGWPGTFAADDTYAYFVEYEFYRVPIAGGSAPEPLTTGSDLSQYYRFDVAVDDDYVFLSASGYSGQGDRVFYVDKTGGTEASIAFRPKSMSALGSGLLTVSTSGLDACTSSSTYRRFEPGSAQQTIATINGIGEAGMADDTHTYFRNHCNDALYRLALGGGSPELLYDSLYDGGMTADADHVYFWGFGGLARLAK